MFSWLVPAAGAVAAIGSSIFGQSKQKSNNRDAARVNYEYGELAAQNAYQRQLDAWNLQNEYNTPLATRQRLNQAGLSTGLMYSGGAAGASNAGSLSSVPQNQSAGTMQPVRGEGYMANMLRGIELTRLESEIGVNKSIENKNNADAGLSGAREENMMSQASLNYALSANAMARTTGQELQNSLNVDMNRLTVQQANQAIAKNEVLLNQYLYDLEKTAVDLSFSKATFDDRAAIVKADLAQKYSQMAVNYAQTKALAAGARLSDIQTAQISEWVKTYVETGLSHNGSVGTNLLNVGGRLYRGIKGIVDETFDRDVKSPNSKMTGFAPLDYTKVYDDVKIENALPFSK